MGSSSSVSPKVTADNKSTNLTPLDGKLIYHPFTYGMKR